MAQETALYRDDVEQVRRRFAEWRSTHAVRSRLPEELWTAAAELGGLEVDDGLGGAHLLHVDQREHFFRPLFDLADERNIDRNLEKPSRGRGDPLDTLYMVEREYGFDIGEGPVVVRGKADLPLLGIDEATNYVADFDLVKVVEARQGREEPCRFLAQLA